MTLVRNGRLLYNEIPAEFPLPGQTTVYDITQTIDLENASLNGGILLKILVLSVDPYLRGKMMPPNPKYYTPMFVVGQPLYNLGVGVVIRSENAALKHGDHVYGFLNFEEYSIVEDVSQFRVLKNEVKLPFSVYGQTAFYGWKAYASDAKEGEIAFVTSGSGAVGSMVIQFAKRSGLKVIASAGSDEKVKVMKEFGADVAFNYKTTSTREILEKEGPINYFWDNVGGEVLDIALEAAAFKARFIECGMITTYNSKPTYVMENLLKIVYKAINIYGLFVLEHESKYEAEFYETIPAMLGTGELKYLEDITVGLENAGEAIRAVQIGTNFGKSVIQVALE